jgi:uncharacterized protein (DUF58 family)
MMSRISHLLVGHRGTLLRIRREGVDTSLRVLQPALPVAFLLFLIWAAFRPTAFALTGVCFTGSVLLISYLWARTMAVSVTTRRELKVTAVQVGEPLEEVVSLENRSMLPVIHAEFVDRSNVPGYSISAVRVSGARASESWRERGICTRRGVYSLGEWEVHLGDPLGLFEVRQAYRTALEVTVCPPLAALPPRFVHRRRTLGDRLPLRQALPADTINVSSTRPYAQGDPVRRIHWRTSARHDELFVRVFEPEASSVMWLIPDLDAAVHVGQGDESTLEKLIIVTASLAAQMLGERQSVGMLMDVGRNRVVAQGAGRPQLWRILRALAMAEAGSSNLLTTLRDAQTILSARDSAVVITPSVDPSWVGMLNGLRRGGPGGVEVVLLDPASFGGSGDSICLARYLEGSNIPAHVLRRPEIHPVLGSYARLRRWEFQTLATGRVVVRQTPRSPTTPAV